MQHHNITDPASVHEAKQILSANTGDAGKVITPSASLPGRGELRRLRLSEIDQQGRNPVTGWAYYTDSQYTSSSPRTVAAGARTQVTVDRLAPRTDNTNAPEGGADMWDATNRIVPIAANDAYLVSLRFKASTAAVDPPMLEVDADVGGTVGVVAKDVRPLARAEGGVNELSVEFSVFADANMVANGATLNVTPVGDAVDLWDFSVMIVRLHKGA